MLPELARPKDPATIYTATQAFYKNDGTIHYIAHAALSDGTLHPLNREVAIAASSGSSAKDHPDQLFWRQSGFPSLADLRASRKRPDLTIVRIEIDCTLMPCAVDKGCLYIVPALIQAIYPGAALRIFSHRDEGMAKQGSTSTKRYFDCRANDRNDVLAARFAENGGWGWQGAPDSRT